MEKSQPPGHVLLSTVLESGIPSDRLAMELGIRYEELIKIYTGEAKVTEQLDYQLHYLIDTPKGYWIELYKEFDNQE